MYLKVPGNKKSAQISAELTEDTKPKLKPKKKKKAKKQKTDKAQDTGIEEQLEKIKDEETKIKKYSKQIINSVNYYEASAKEPEKVNDIFKDLLTNIVTS